VRVNVNRIRLREEVLYWLGAGYKLSRGCMTSRNLRTYSLLASSCLVIFQIHAESLFFHLINVEKSLAQQLGLVVSTNEIVVQNLLSTSL